MHNPIKVLYEDSHLIVFNKPAGLLVIPSPQEKQNTLVEYVNKEHVDPEGRRLFPCHRIDRDTSGVILFAWGKKNQQQMMLEFQNLRVEKTYIAFVQGHLTKPAGEIRKPIFDFHQKRFARHAAPKPAVTGYRVLEEKEEFSVIEAKPLTGRTNQIRIHFKEIGHPLVGERLYAFGKDFKLKFRRTALHAQDLGFWHPFLKRKIEVSAPLADDMARFLDNH